MLKLKGFHFPATLHNLRRRMTMNCCSKNSQYPQFISLPLPPHPNESQPRPTTPTIFRLVSYNILAQVYVKSSYFPHSPSPCLKWKTRSKALLSLLTNLGADFLCLQEVDEFDTFYKPNLDSFGFSALYVQRSAQKRDGCALFYSRQKAELVSHEDIHYNDLVDSIEEEEEENDNNNNKNNATLLSHNQILEEGDRGDPNDPRVRLKRDCVGVMAAFRLKDCSDHVVIVANTHLYWDPEWADVKLAQAKYLLSRLARFKKQVNERFSCTSSLIVAGDFNSTPGDKVYECLVSGEDAPIGLSSVYGSTNGEPKFTNCTPDFTDTLDYILFTSSGPIKPVSLLELPGPDSSDVAGGLPNASHPSDHLPIGAEFEIRSSL